VKVDTAEGANGDSNGELRDRRRSGMNDAFTAGPPSILADSITTPICVRETTKFNRLIHSDGLANRNRRVRPELRVPTARRRGPC
jgi:hypothetical protein